MKKGKCLKCGSSEIYTTDNGTEISIGINSRNRGNFLFTNYICMKCGYMESYLNFEPPAALTENIMNEKKRAKIEELYRKRYEERLQLIKDNWKKVGW